jgi:fatty acid desaturase
MVASISRPSGDRLLPDIALASGGENRIQVRELSRRSDWRAALTIAADWLVIFAAAATSLLVPWKAVYVLSVIVIARQMNVIAELHHQAMHANLFRRKRLNAWLECCYSLPYFTRVSADLAEHMEHHATYSVANNDHLTWGAGYGLKLAKRCNRTYMLWFLLVRPFCGVLQWQALRDLVQSPNWRQPAFRRVMLTFWGLVLLALYAIGRVDVIFWYWLAPYFTFYQVFFFWDDMMGHYNCPRTGTRDMRGWAFRLYTGHSSTHHNIHHRYPAIPWFRAPRATQLLIDSQEMDIAHGFWNGVGQMLDSNRP